MKTRNLMFSAVVAVCAVFGIETSGGNERNGQTRHYDAQLAIDWNERVNNISFAEGGWFTFKGVRAHAMMHIAMHDALNSIEPRYHQYAYSADRNNHAKIDPIAAAVTAAFEVVVNQYPNERASLESLRDQWLARVNGAQPKERGIALGRAAAAAILSQRADDNWDAAGRYSFQPPLPGVYQTYPPFGTPPGPGFVFGAGFALAKPFVMTSQNQFRPGPPSSVASVEYANAFNEVKD